jgi:hypothetical protein
MARGFAKRLDASLAIIDKRRPRANVSEVLNVVGEVEGRDCILADDMIDTAGTVTEDQGSGGDGHDPRPAGTQVREAHDPLGGGAAQQGDQVHACRAEREQPVRLRKHGVR